MAADYLEDDYPQFYRYDVLQPVRISARRCLPQIFDGRHWQSMDIVKFIRFAHSIGKDEFEGLMAASRRRLLPSEGGSRA
jgi:hypothetical protein